MNAIVELRVHSVRNIDDLHLNLHPQCNLIYGPNGCGKTSLLESMYILTTGHSFRTREAAPIVSHGISSLTVFARLYDQQVISVTKSTRESTQIKLNGSFCNRTSDLAYQFPCQYFYQDIFDIMDAGPMVRRGLLDWGVFHVEHSFLELWKKYRLILKQRNALLRQQADYTAILPWDNQLIALSETIHQIRMNYFNQWKSKFEEVLSHLATFECTMQYYKGWDKQSTGKSLEASLIENYDRDKARQYTHSGIHNADILFETAQYKAKLCFSRGQQKIVLFALKLSQAAVLKKPCLYLMDDMTAELDTVHIERLANYLQDIQGQFILTGIDGDKLKHAFSSDYAEVNLAQRIEQGNQG